jgi:hypothetical protein
MPRKTTKPPICLRKKYAGLIARCRELIITAVPQTSGVGGADKLITIVCKWPLREGHRPSYKVPDLPQDFPTGVVVERFEDSVVIKHNVVAILKWAKAKHFTDYDAADLFARRLPAMMVLAKMELKLDRLLQDIDVDPGGSCVEMPQHSEDKLDSRDKSE